MTRGSDDDTVGAGPRRRPRATPGEPDTGDGATSVSGPPAMAEPDAPTRRDGAPDAQPIRPGDRLGGRYQVVELLGRGGMGAVYLAMDEALSGRPVALKVVSRELQAEDALDELRHEVLAAQRVTHRNVCRVYDLERIDGRWILKMEWIAGDTLAARQRRGPMSVAEAIAIARQIALGLDAAHREGLVHRDLKPANVMIEEGTGRVVLMDFGIAVAAAGDATSDHAGTPAYMAPEQLRGERIDPRADVYALGGVLYHLLVGEVAFPASSLDTAASHRAPAGGAALPDPRGKRPEIPPWLGRAVQAMIAHDPAARPRDAQEVLRLLDGPARRRRTVRGVVAGVGLVAVAGAAAAVAFGGAGAGAGADRAAWAPLIRELEPGYDENVDSVAWSPDGTRLAFSTDREKSGHLRARVRVVAGPGADGEPDEAPVSPPAMNALFITWSRDGRSLYFTDIADEMKTWRIPAGGGGTPERIGQGYVIECGDQLLLYEFSSPGCPNCPRFVLRDGAGGEREALRLDSQAFVTTYRCDRDGTRVVWSRAEQGAPFYQPADLWIAELATGATRRLTTDRRRNAYPAFAPDGQSVVFSSARNGGVVNLWEMSLATGAAVQLTFGDGNDLLPDVSPDGTQLAFSVDVTSMPLFAHPVVANAPGPSPAAPRLTPARVILSHPQAMPGGAEILATDFGPLQPRIVAVSVRDGRVRPLGDGVIATVTPDGAEVAYVAGGNGEAASELRAVPAAGGASRAVATLDGRVRMLRAGPDGVVHAMLDRGSSLEAWAVPLDGGPARREAEAPWCFVQPAPAGGWHFHVRCTADGRPTVGVLVPPGGTPDPDAPGLRMDGQLSRGGDFDAAGRHFFIHEEPTFARVELATGEKTRLFDQSAFFATVSSDGQTLYTAVPVGRSRRHLITNFASRLRP